MNIVIPYRYERNAVELKYALRSIESYLKGYGEIFLVGERFPSWLQNVHYITCAEETAKSPVNIINKLLKASSVREVGDPFIRWDDDIYLTRELNVSGMEYWYDGTLGQAIDKHFGKYKQIIQNTAYKVTDSEKYFDVHAPIIIHERFLLRTAKLDWAKPMLVKTSYCNNVFEISGTEMRDCKIGGPGKDVLKEIEGSLFFSTGPLSIEPKLVEALEKLYPKPSKYER